jgi:PleD family two-component response regulator
MNPVKGQYSEDHFPKIKGVFQDHNFFRFYHYMLTPNIRPNISLNNHSEFRGSDSKSNNRFITDNTEKQRILVVDDDRDISNLYKLSLEHDGFIVHSFNDPLLVLSTYKAGAYDLLLLDINMPQMNGFELYQKIRLVDDHTKVCFISAFEEYETEFKELFPDLNESDCFIRKPIELDSLTKKVKSRLQSN